METIYSTKQFLTGPLKGLVHHEQLTVDLTMRKTMPVFKGKQGKDALTKDRYQIIDCSFQKYTR